jgi:hypothetical protein
VPSLGRFHHAADHELAFFEQCIWFFPVAEGFSRPAEQAGVKLLLPGFIRGDEFIPAEFAGLGTILFLAHNSGGFQ